MYTEAEGWSVVTPVAPPIGMVEQGPPVVSADFLRIRLDAITIG
ncbi:hypothetical protein [Nocardia sp. NPDC058480]